ncbi:fimbria/pilus outer membrane usher protein [Enterobacteriaceae bacterium RIT711]|nr:fimbria/pilus outer membrane usher protein [Enterobacteriaceae bacterium RIT711]
MLFFRVKLDKLITIIGASVLLMSNSYGKIYFNPQAFKLNSSDDAIDTSVYEKNNIAPGSYHSYIYVNNTYLEERDVSYSLFNDDKLYPDLSSGDLEKLGVNVNQISRKFNLQGNINLAVLKNVIPEISANYDASTQRLDLAIPQAYLFQIAYDEVPRNQWDYGVNALFSNYSLSASDDLKNDEKAAYLGLQNGLNIGEWRLRNSSSYNVDMHGSGHWNTLSTYLQHDFQSLNAQIIAGRTSTAATLFDSLLMDGVQIFSDDNMLPTSQQGFAPIIHGIANSESQVTVKQNGYIIYQNYVPAGPFTISDLNSLTNGNLEVTVKGADGVTRSFIQAYSTVPGMQREGHIRFSGSVGKYAAFNNEKEPVFLQSQFQYGLNNFLTIYSGTELAKNYQALLGGLVLGMDKVGAISFDVTHAITNSVKKDGNSIRLQYAKKIDGLGTNISLAGYRYSSSGFYDFTEANEISAHSFNDTTSFANKRSRTQLQINQPLENYGGITLTGYYQNFWNTGKTERNISIAYNTSFWGLYSNVNFMESKVSDFDGTDKVISFNISVPFERFAPYSSLHYSLLNTNHGETRNEVALDGYIDKQRTWQYDLRSSYSSDSSSKMGGGLSMSHIGRYGDVSAGYFYNSNYKQINMSARGGVVAHSGGVTLSQPLGNTFAILHANNAENIKIDNYDGISTDRNGYVILPYLASYHRNKISLNANSIPEDFDLDELVTNLTPTEGSVVKSDFGGYKGYQIFIKLISSNGILPFGSVATLKGAKTITGLIDDKGIVYLKGMPEEGVIESRWGKGVNQQCSAKYKLNGNKSPLQRLVLKCN